MGKGSRNRQLHQQEKIDHPEKYKKKRHAPKWLSPLIGIVLVVAIVVGAVAGIISSNGIIQRNRIILESQSGKFDVNQNMATFIAWQSLYYNASMYWTYCSYGLIEDTYNITKSYTVDQYALTVAQNSLDTELRSSIDDVLESIKLYVAVCDVAYAEKVELKDEDMTSVTEAIDELEKLREEYGYTSLKAFLKTSMGKGMKEKDIRDALEMIALYNKYCTVKQVAFEKAVTLADVEAFRDKHPEDYYKTDYLTFATENEEFAKVLAALTDPEVFKSAILNDHFDNNYKTAYNKYTTQVKATDALTSIKGKTNNNNGTALSEALAEIGAIEKTYNKNDEENEDLEKWLFATARKQYETAMVTSENVIYVVAFLSETANESSVKAAVAKFDFVEGNTHGSDEGLDPNFKNNIKTYLTESKKDEPSYPEVNYKKADAQAKDFETLLKAEGADKEKLLEDADAKTVTGVTSSTASSVLPEAVRDEATKSGVKEGDILVVDDGNVSYVIVIKTVSPKKADVTYATFNGDIYYQVINDLTDSLAKVYPTDKTANYKSDAKADTYEAWLSELSNKDTLTSARKAGDAKYFTTEPTDKEKEDGKKTTYNVYMVINTPMYLDKEAVVNGGYVLFDDKGFAEAANNALQTLANKTHAELTNALKALDSSATVSATIKASSVTDAKLKEWFFSDARVANESAVITNTSGSGAYVAVFVEDGEAWYSTAKSNYVSDQLQTWMDGLAAQYTPNEKALNRIGEPSTETNTATTTASK